MNIRKFVEPQVGDVVKITAKCERFGYRCDCYMDMIGKITEIKEEKYTIKFPNSVCYCTGFTKSCFEVIQ